MSDGRQLPNNLSWMALRDVNSNLRFEYDEWLGAVIALLTPDESYTPQNAPQISLQIRLDIQFRGRVFNQAVYETQSLTQAPPSDIYGTMEQMRNSFLTGEYFPLEGFDTINVANIGHDLSINAVGYKFRINSTGKIYTVDTWNNPTLTWSASESA
jgi:hypothetical protein